MRRAAHALRSATTLLFLGFVFGCAPIQIQSNPDAFEVPLEAPPKLRGQQTVDLVNGYKVATEAKLFLGGPGWVGDLREYTRTAITLMARELRKVGIEVGPSPKSIVLKVHGAQAAPGAFLIPASLALDAEYGDGTKSAIAESDSASTAWRAVDGALVRAVARLLVDERFQAYVNAPGPTEGVAASTPSAARAPAAAATPAVAATTGATAATPAGLPAPGTLWQYRYSERLFARRTATVSVRVLRASDDLVEEAVSSDAQGAQAASRSVSTRELRILRHPLVGDSALLEVSSYALARGGGNLPADVGTVHGYPLDDPSRTPWRTSVRGGDWEQVEVPAGRFRALRLEIRGERQLVGAHSGTGRFQLVAWFAPEAKRFVRLEHKAWSGAVSAGGQAIVDDVVELTAYRPSGN